MNKYIKKLISVVLSAILMLSCIPSYAVEADEADSSRAYELLTALGIINDMDMIYYEDIISRAVFVKYAVRCSGLAVSAGETLPDGIFEDIDINTEGYDEIILARKMNLISDAKYFYPDRSITRNEAAKILVSMLGYGEDAEYKGGYPNAYLISANNLKILNGISFENDGTIDVNNFVMLLVNTLEAKPLSIYKVVGDTNEIYCVGRENDNPLMSQTLGVYKVTGIVTSNAYASLYGMSRVSKGRILIGGSEYLVNESDALEYLGINVEAYYKHDTKTDKKTVIYLNEYDNKIVTVLSEDIVINETTSSVFTYYKTNDKKESVTGLGSVPFIYNGGLKSINETDLEPANGAVILIDNNLDGRYDVIKSNNYRTVFVSSVSSLNKTVTDSLGGAKLDLDITKGTFDVIIEKDGRPASFEDIQKDDIISYAESGIPASGDIIKIAYVSTKKCQGEIESISGKILTIDGVKYNTAQSVLTSSAPGDEGVFYIDMYDRIVVKKAIKDMVYGYIKNKGTGSGLNGGYLFEIFTENNRWVELRLADTVKMVKADATTGRYSAQVAYSNTAAGQLVRYKVNQDAEITEIHLAQNIPAYSAAEDDAIANDVFRKSMDVCTGATYVSYRSTVSSFGNLVGLRDDTKIFVIPDPGYSTDRADFYVVNSSSLRGDGWYYDITAYDVDKSVQAGACVMISNTNRNIIDSVDGESSFMIVQSVSRALTDDGEDTFVLNGAYSGYTDANLRMSPNAEIIDDHTDASISVQSIQPGDIVQLAFDTDGYVASVTRFYNVTAQAQTPFCTSTSEYSTSTKMAGVVSRVQHSDYKIVFNNNITANGLYSISNLNRVYIYHKARNIITLADVGDIEQGDYIVAYVRQFSLREAVIVK